MNTQTLAVYNYCLKLFFLVGSQSFDPVKKILRWDVSYFLFFYFLKVVFKVDFLLSVWLQEKEREIDHMDKQINNLVSHRKHFLSVWSLEKIEFNSFLQAQRDYFC